MSGLKTTAAVCTGFAMTVGCSSQAPLRVSEVTRDTDGRYSLVISDDPAHPTILPERIVTPDGVFVRAEEHDVREFIARYLNWPVSPENKIEAFGSTYYRLDPAAAEQLHSKQ